ncbi:MAG: Do family serine endopeptidase [Hyphomicrobiaceae bacterium]|nr:MAG: Do family serine endopeptidase [Hyphomicrobiaceae bacterium]
MRLSRAMMKAPAGRRLCALMAASAGIALALTVADKALAQRKEPPPSREAAQYSFAPIVKKAAPAVVNVYVRARVQTFVSPFAEDPLFRRFFGEAFGMPQERIQNSLGSGVIVSPTGIVVTNNHVIKVGGAAEIKVALADRREFDAKVILQDEKSDIAVLRIEGGDGRFPYLQFENSDTIEVGDLVLAIGNPFGVGQTVTSGIISALARTEVAQSQAQVFIQTDAAINPGNSGGALVDMAGRVVGINTAIFSRSGGSHGIGFAIPSNLVKLYVDSAVTGRKVERPWIGAKLDAVTRDIAEGLKLDRVAGAVIVRLYPNSPAAEAGLEAGDVIVAVDGYEVTDARAVNYRLTTRGIGNRARLDVVRKGRRMTVEVSLRAPPAAGRDDIRNLAGPHPFDGARVANILPGMADELGIDDQDGVVVLSVRGGATAARLGFRQGDIIVQVGRQKIETVAELEGLLKDRQRLWQVVVKRGQQVLQLQVPG